MSTKLIRPSEESSFEHGIAVTKPVKAISDAAKQQAKQIANDFVSQLYGVSDKSSSDANDPNAQVQAQAQVQAKQAQAQQTPPPKPVRKLGGMSDSGDHAKYAMMQDLLDKGDQKGADEMMHHMQYYYDNNIGTLEEQVKKAGQKVQQTRQEKEKQQQEDEEKKKQELAQKNEELPQSTGKGRNRMGKKAKTDMGLKMGQMKTETFRGSSG